jgi:hypothetical protein
MISLFHLQRSPKTSGEVTRALATSSKENISDQAQVTEWARRVALRDREAVFLAWPVSWPAMMVKEMDSGYCAENGLSSFGSSDQVASPTKARRI